MTTTRSLLILAKITLLVACAASDVPAPVVDRLPPPKGEASRVSTPQTAPKSAELGYYTVRKGDTLIQIALEFGQNYRDLVVWNNLQNPNDIKVDQVLRVLPPENGAQTGSVTSTSGVETRPLTPQPTAATNKSVPRGEKRPYSDAALAELQKPDSAISATSAPVGVGKTPDRVADKTPDAPPLASDDDSVAWVWPADGKVTGGFSETRKGIDIAGKLGQTVLAAGAGKVLYAGSGIRGYGNLVIIKHSNNLLSAYAHNKTIFVKEDQTVAKGQKIAEMGNSDSDVVKLHFEIRQQGKPVDPARFLPGR